MIWGEELQKKLFITAHVANSSCDQIFFLIFLWSLDFLGWQSQRVWVFLEIPNKVLQKGRVLLSVLFNRKKMAGFCYYFLFYYFFISTIDCIKNLKGLNLKNVHLSIFFTYQLLKSKKKCWKETKLAENFDSKHQNENGFIGLVSNSN